MRVVIAGGGTAGHVEPALATADALRRRDPAVDVTMLGTARGIETRLVPARGYPLALIPPVPLPRRPTPDLAAVPVRLLRAVEAAGGALESRPDVVVGFGGYVAVPAYLAARRRRIPIVVHEANARPGLANRLGARLTRHVATAMPDTPLPHARWVGMPLRREIATLDRARLRAKARADLGLDADLPTLLVFGGSQGARRLNTVVLAATAALRAGGIQVLHLAGTANAEQVRAALGDVEGPPHVVLPYLDRMELGYAAADLALCRGGAMTCAELAAVGLPAAYVPLPIGNGEQRRNAAPLVTAGGGLLIDDARLDADWIASVLVPLAADADRLAAMSAAAARFGVRDGDERLADLVWAAAGR